MAYHRRIKARGMGTSLPMPIIQHIQSFLSGRQAAQSSVLSKSWYNAWLTRPDLILNQSNFHSYTDFVEFVTKTVGRYDELSINFSSVKLQLDYFYSHSQMAYADELIMKVLKLCADGTDCDFQFLYDGYVLPSEVLGSERIARLSVSGGKIFRPPGGRVECSRLKSLRLYGIQIDDDRLFLDTFPSLVDLALFCCYGYRELEISGTSLELITVMGDNDFMGKFNVPNIRKFIFSGSKFPKLSLQEVSREWESNISVNHFHHFYCEPWFLKLKVLLETLSKSRCKVFLNIGFFGHDCDNCCGCLSEPKIPQAENLTLTFSSELFGYDGLLGSLFMTCHPKFITQDWFPMLCGERKADNDVIKFLCKRLIKDRQRNDCGYAYLVGLKDVNVEIFEEVLGKWIHLPWQTLLNGSEGRKGKQKIRFQLVWG